MHIMVLSDRPNFVDVRLCSRWLAAELRTTADRADGILRKKLLLARWNGPHHILGDLDQSWSILISLSQSSDLIWAGFWFPWASLIA